MEEAQRDAPDEVSLAARAAQGDHDAFRLIVLAYETPLVVYLTQMLGDGETARDIAQETFLAAYRALPRWRPPEPANGTTGAARPLSPWLYRIATNRALSLLRSRHAAPVSPNTSVTAIPAAAAQLEERTAARDLLQAALSHLTDEDAACLVLHYVAGERYAEIAARLGMSSETIRKRVSRGLVVLRAAYRALDVEVLA